MKPVFVCLLSLIVFGTAVGFLFAPKSRDVSVSLTLKDKTIRKPVVPSVWEVEKTSQSSQEKEITSEAKNGFPVKVQMKKADCAKLFASNKAVFETYRPEISTTGKMVAPADLPLSEQGIVPANLPDAQKDSLSAIASDISFPVLLQLKKRYPYLESDIKTGDVPLVFVSVKNGEVFINGVPVDSNDLETVRQACRNTQ